MANRKQSGLGPGARWLLLPLPFPWPVVSVAHGTSKSVPWAPHITALGCQRATSETRRPVRMGARRRLRKLVAGFSASTRPRCRPTSGRKNASCRSVKRPLCETIRLRGPSAGAMARNGSLTIWCRHLRRGSRKRDCGRVRLAPRLVPFIVSAILTPPHQVHRAVPRQTRSRRISGGPQIGAWVVRQNARDRGAVERFATASTQTRRPSSTRAGGAPDQNSP